MQFTAVLLFVASTLAATSSPMAQCATEFTLCQQSANAVTLFTKCSTLLAACAASGAMTTDDESLGQTMSDGLRKAYRKCREEYSSCRGAPRANLSTCANEALGCFADGKRRFDSISISSK
ncbi:uncharacterized protein RCC_01838 [Ramularia collo-cygni]|uniref:Uncharacterized protein n=1 Tax=Ramularia collo-cygni TaxID=112498 RepID=A0A2D3UPR2_9PEZI|nr:uncharacterized protein RCC_01838 [Ramularia collo-cygni]CZT15998.1 uncharacterized protein RCC_01838 [Ramularia collo-cygni]